MAEEAPDDAVQSLVTMRVLNSAGHPKAWLESMILGIFHEHQWVHAPLDMFPQMKFAV